MWSLSLLVVKRDRPVETMYWHSRRLNVMQPTIPPAKALSLLNIS